MAYDYIEISLKKTADPAEYPLRINRFLALAGVTTRRNADVFIEKGWVILNGKPATIGQYVRQGDKVEVSENALSRSQYVFLAYNKPKDADSDKTLSNFRFKPHVFPVGRLDKEDEGLIIATNDIRAGDLLQDPKQKIYHEYVVHLQEKVNEGFVIRLKKAAELETGSKAYAELLASKSLRIKLVGTKKVLHSLCESLHHTLLSVKRTRFGPITLKGIGLGAYRKIEGDDLNALLSELGTK